MNGANGDLWGGYCPDGQSYDEMTTADGLLRPQWQQFRDALAMPGMPPIVDLQRGLNRLLRENGVTYLIRGDAAVEQRPWTLDFIPHIIAADDWLKIESALKQRCMLLDLILKDVYGPQRLLADGLLPPEVIYGHEGFLRACVGTRGLAPRELLLYAGDLTRGPDGRMWVIADRTQAPAGLGYALENRTAITRVAPNLFGHCQVRRLSFFFQTLRDSLAELSPRKTDAPRIVVLTAGPHDESYFEDAYLAAYLGFGIANGDDLTVRDDRLWFKDIEGLEPVDVVFRRLDDLHCDPLELAPHGAGVAGLTEVLRQQRVGMVNPLGSSILENPGLMPFLPTIARVLLGEDLMLPSAATWWCGHAAERGHVIANLDRLVIKSIHTSLVDGAIFGPLLTAPERETLGLQIAAAPHLYVGQELLSFSALPSLVNGRVRATHATLKTFVVSHHDTYHVLPGGLTRSARGEGNLRVSTDAGGTSKDTWVLADQPEPYVSLWLQSERRRPPLSATRSGLSSRAAENLHWVGRYAERTEFVARLLRAVLRRLQENIDSDAAEQICRQRLLVALARITGAAPGFLGRSRNRCFGEPWEQLLNLLFDVESPGSVSGTLRALVNGAYAVRPRWSGDTWRILNDLQEHWRQFEQSELEGLQDLQSNIDDLITLLSAFAGLNMESMVRQQGWRFLDSGHRLERGLMMLQLLRYTLVKPETETVRDYLLEAVLTTAESLITYRRRYRSYLQLDTALELLLLDESNPRALIYQLVCIQEHLRRLPGASRQVRLGPAERMVLEASTEVRLADLRLLAEASRRPIRNRPLDGLLLRQIELLSGIEDCLTQLHFSHVDEGH